MENLAPLWKSFRWHIQGRRKPMNSLEEIRMYLDQSSAKSNELPTTSLRKSCWLSHAKTPFQFADRIPVRGGTVSCRDNSENQGIQKVGGKAESLQISEGRLGEAKLESQQIDCVRINTLPSHHGFKCEMKGHVKECICAMYNNFKLGLVFDPAWLKGRSFVLYLFHYEGSSSVEWGRLWDWAIWYPKHMPH